MKPVLISIQPKWCEKICNGEKTIEVRKTAPQEVPFKCYIYETQGRTETPWVDEDGHFIYKGRGQVIGEFVCDWVTKIIPSCDIWGFVNQYIHGYPAILGYDDCLSFKEMNAYLGNKKGYDWHISDLKIYDKPKELSEFKKTKEIIARTCGMQARNGLCCAIDHEELCDNIKCCFKTPCPPQSWCYVEDLGEEK